MTSTSLNSCVIRSLQLGYMDDRLPDVLLTPNRTRVRRHPECKYWDYKESIVLDTASQIAEFAKDAVAFYNTDGGAFIVGVTDDTVAKGIPNASHIDSKKLTDKLRSYVGEGIELFQHVLELPADRHLLLIFIRRHLDRPLAMARNGPAGKNGRPLFVTGDYFFREGDEVKRCQNDGDAERVFRGFSSEHLTAYNYEIDAPYFRLLNPNYDRFVGRKSIVTEIRNALESRHPVIALDGLGGVGKTAIAIEVARQLYDEQKYMFIASLSAKSRIWLGHVSTRRAVFAGLQGLLQEIAAVFPDVEYSSDISQLKERVISFMKEVDGLLLIDNLEEIDDPGVLNFISREVPDPVKVLITSRVDKKIGALTISVPAMDQQEAGDLLQGELSRLGYDTLAGDDEHLKALIDASGRVPLAIKWAAQITSERNSARTASSILRGAGSGKQEFLSFCFATMYDALSDVGKDAARLVPYLDDEWKPLTLCIALDLSLDVVKLAINEISDRGILFRADDDEEGFTVLPLTREFLHGKWSESDALRKRVLQRLTEMFSSDQTEGFLLDWPEERRVEFLAQRAEEKAKSGDYENALKLVRLAQTWTNEARLRFLEGKFLYQSGSKAAGIAHMRQAAGREGEATTLPSEELHFFAEALLTDGSAASGQEAAVAIVTGSQRSGKISSSLCIKFVELCAQKRDYRHLVALLSKLDGESLESAVAHMEQVFAENSFIYVHHREVISAFDRLKNIVAIDPERRKQYADRSELLKKIYRTK